MGMGAYAGEQPTAMQQNLVAYFTEALGDALAKRQAELSKALVSLQEIPSVSEMQAILPTLLQVHIAMVNIADGVLLTAYETHRLADAQERVATATERAAQAQEDQAQALYRLMEEIARGR